MDKKLTIIFIIILILGGITGAYFYLFSKNQEKKATWTDPLLLKIKEEGKIVFGTEASYPPMENIDENGNFVGIDIEIAKEIAKDLGVKAEFKNIPFDTIFDKVNNGEVDAAISAITITPERIEKLLFSDPYFNAGQVILTLSNRNDISGQGSLYNKKVGVQSNTTSFLEAQKYVKSDLIVQYESYDLAKKDLLENKIDAILIDFPAALSAVSENKNFKIVGEPFTQEFYGIAVRKDSTALLNEINKTIRRLKIENRLEEIINKWLRK
ncbi:MAG: basic amino acid ABC transporter substrate-binding protein [Minisyncoccia bacterium]